MAAVRMHLAVRGDDKLAICAAYKRLAGNARGTQTVIQGRALQAPYLPLSFPNLAAFRAWAAEQGGKVVVEVAAG